MRLARGCLIVAVGLLLAGAATLRADEPSSVVIDEPMMHDPDIPVPGLERVPPTDALPLWKQALKRPEVDLRRRAVESLGLAYTQGLKAAQDSVPEMLTMLQTPDQDPYLTAALVHALTELDDPRAAEALYKRDVHGTSDLQIMIDPALARWEYRAAGPMWQRRALDANASDGVRVSAIKALATMKVASAQDALHTLVGDDQAPAAVRLAAAAALATIAPDRQHDAAAELLVAPPADAAGSLLHRLLAARLLAHSSADKDMSLLLKLADDADTAVARQAVDRLVAVDGRLLMPLNEHLVASRTAEIRRAAVAALEQQATPGAVKLLGSVLGDEYISVRSSARDALVRLARAGPLKPAVLDQAQVALYSDSWRAREQGADIAGLLDDTRQTQRLLTLLNDARGEVAVASVVALRRMAQPETIPPLLQHAADLTAKLQAALRGGFTEEYHLLQVDEQLSQINQYLGLAGYTPAWDYLKKFVPKPPMYQGYGAQARAGAIWAIGKLYAGDEAKVKELLPQFERRLVDNAMMDPELPIVRHMVAVDFVRFNARQEVPLLKSADASRAGEAARWAAAQLSGEAYTPPKPAYLQYPNYFLESSR